MRTRGWFAATVAAVLVSAVLAPSANAQESAPGGSQEPSATPTVPGAGDAGTTTTLPVPPTTTPPATSVPGSSTTTTAAPPEGGAGDGDGTTTTTIPGELLPPVTIPPELAADPRAPILFDPSPGDGLEVPEFQAPFDPGSNQVLDGVVNELRAELQARQRLLSEMQVRLLELEAQVEALTAEVDELGESARAKVREAAEAEAELREHTVDAYVNGTSEVSMVLARADDPVELGVARELLDSLVEADEAVLARHQVAQARLDARQTRLLAELGEVQAELTELNQTFASVLEDTVAGGRALKAYEAGAQVYVKGFVFPVQGEVEFIDSWGYPRMMGTSQAHWHQGTDIFAPMGTPLVAVESGEVFKVGQAGLGGNRLWIRGDSGTEYYYAHVSAFATGLHDGQRVNAGDVVAYVGDTGNAKGTPPHLHFQLHPGGGDPVNPYPILKATYGTRPMVEVFEAPPTSTVPDAAVTDAPEILVAGPGGVGG